MASVNTQICMMLMEKIANFFGLLVSVTFLITRRLYLDSNVFVKILLAYMQQHKLT